MRQLLPRLFAAILSREATQNLGCANSIPLPNTPVAAPPWWRLAPWRWNRRSIAAAFVHGDFESGSDSKSGLCEFNSSSQHTGRCAAVVAACALSGLLKSFIAVGIRMGERLLFARAFFMETGAAFLAAPVFQISGIRRSICISIGAPLSPGVKSSSKVAFFSVNSSRSGSPSASSAR